MANIAEARRILEKIIDMKTINHEVRYYAKQALSHLEDAPPCITCPQCGKTSYHPEDIANKYCGHCHQFHSDMVIRDKR